MSTTHNNIRGSAKPGETVWVFLCRSCREPITFVDKQLDAMPTILSLDCSNCHSRD